MIISNMWLNLIIYYAISLFGLCFGGQSLNDFNFKKQKINKFKK